MGMIMEVFDSYYWSSGDSFIVRINKSNDEINDFFVG